MAYRASWKGYLKVSLVSCPVELYNATTQAQMVVFHLLNPKTMNRIQMRPFDPEKGELQRQELIRGYEIEQGKYVTVEEEELKNLRLESTRTIDIEKFVDADDIDPVYADGPYYLAPDGKDAVGAFAVIREAMRMKKKVALARLVLSHRERIIAISPRGKGMLVEMLRHPQEIRSDKEIFDDITAVKFDKGMVEIASKIIDQKSGTFEPKEFKDRYEVALRELIDARAKGKVISRPERPRDTKVIDLMSALKASLAHRSGAGSSSRKNGEVVPLHPSKDGNRKKARHSAQSRRRARG
jgi:DNA end-binding protein Ku